MQIYSTTITIATDEIVFKKEFLFHDDIDGELPTTGWTIGIYGYHVHFTKLTEFGERLWSDNPLMGETIYPMSLLPPHGKKFVKENCFPL